ncbi:hypothetical protein J7K76_03635 [Candidatus Bipolaricaulota bacterium]|nr:hypothetical protein [Candidatus Bipolaricaulota bacterium]
MFRLDRGGTRSSAFWFEGEAATRASDGRDHGSSGGLEGENVGKIKGESGLSAIELAQLRGFAKFLPELRARKPKRKPRFNWVGDLKPQEFA